ncbi:MAG: hypothetical protein L0Y44_13490 [Phycisphaerales bacterium]|nr:hypothetical protein [Phycisphaerales bacterium]MCI0631657.1 hypothetical protein [Phycisphaerales bacterium]MCI0674958.1 hypothetical protein [Phycisphaerales bacterium]
MTIPPYKSRKGKREQCATSREYCRERASLKGKPDKWAADQPSAEAQSLKRIDALWHKAGRAEIHN